MIAESIGVIASSLAAGLAVNSLSDHIPTFAKKIVASAVRIQYGHQSAVAEVREEEWLELIGEIAGNFLKLLAALSIFISSIVWRLGRADGYSQARKRGLNLSYARAIHLLPVGSLVCVAIAINVTTSDRNSVPWWIASAVLALCYAAFVTTSRSRKSSVDSLIWEIYRQVDQRLRGTQNSTFDPFPFDLQASPKFTGHYTSINEILTGQGAQQRIAVVGDAGSGKTSLLYEIARQSLDHSIGGEHPRIPVLLHASSWHSQESLTQWLTDELSYRFRLKKSTAYDLILQGGVLLFLDGLDEVPHLSLLEMGQTLSDSLDGCRALSIVTTCRTDAFKTLSPHLRNFVVLKAAPLTKIEIRNCLHGLPSEIDSFKIENALEANEILAHAATDPLLLRLLVYAHFGKALDPNTSTDSTWLTLALGNDLAEHGDSEAALRVFNAIARGQTSLTTTLADVLSAQLLATLGRHEDADVAFARARSSYGLLLENLPTSSKTAFEIDEDQQKLLRSLRMGVTYDVSQIASISLLPPGVVQRALSALLRAGLVAREEGPNSEESHIGRRWRLTEAAASEKNMS